MVTKGWRESKSVTVRPEEHALAMLSAWPVRTGALRVILSAGDETRRHTVVHNQMEAVGR
jgi:hypothetical protein